MSGTENYTYITPPANSGITLGMLVRTSDQAHIPCDLENRDYQAFLAWIAEGNTAPEGWTGPTNPAGATA